MLGEPAAANRGLGRLLVGRFGQKLQIAAAQAAPSGPIITYLIECKLNNLFGLAFRLRGDGSTAF